MDRPGIQDHKKWHGTVYKMGSKLKVVYQDYEGVKNLAHARLEAETRKAVYEERYGKMEKRKIEKLNTEKLDNNISRVKSTVIELALCNDWEFFITLTLDPVKYDRHDLDKVVKDFNQWCRNERMKGYPMQYLLIPEHHKKDDAWHLHGLMKGIDLEQVQMASKENCQSKKLWGKYFVNMKLLNKFGYNTFDKVGEKNACAFYMTKYLTKDLKNAVDLGRHSYFASQGLNRKQRLEHFQADAIPEPTADNRRKDFKYCTTLWYDQKTEE